jgi:hypothetical protein
LAIRGSYRRKVVKYLERIELPDHRILEIDAVWIQYRVWIDRCGNVVFFTSGAKSEDSKQTKGALENMVPTTGFCQEDRILITER